MTVLQLSNDAIERIEAAGIRTPERTGFPEDPVRTCTWTPDLTAEEQTTVDDLARMARAGITSLTLAEFQALKPTLSGLASYRNLASPTNAQSVAAIKGIIDVLRALVVD